ncbi:hypothetical protein TCON_0797 [Astathelohania contejeani]|uniref:Uncharacterized protein n=1 Tax=Astathelohania contejeani TaxID=164912 RepID=A0ABQ7I0M9_9MICR|nr:hypothetical protein TCON_0797 [Thelohania contejeani]
MKYRNINFRAQAIYCYIKHRNVFGRNDALQCQHYGKAKKSIDHLATGCDRMVGHDYTRRHNEVLRCIHLLLANKYGYIKTTISLSPGGHRKRKSNNSGRYNDKDRYPSTMIDQIHLFTIRRRMKLY